MSEHDSQVAVIQWAYIHEVRYPELAMLFAVPNAGKRSIGAARYYLAEGLKSGVPDLILPVPAIEHRVEIEQEWTGLVIEMKDGKNKTTENQDWWLQHLAHYGWKAAVHYSANAAIKEICDYLKLPVELHVIT
jgi:hypothetical protein